MDIDLAGAFGPLFASGRELSVPVGADYFSVLVGVLTGALFACDRKLDIIGTIVLGLVTAYGGGILRDLLMQNHGVYFTSDPGLIVLCVVLCFFVFNFRGLFRHLEATVFFADALSVGLFALAGASKAFQYEYGIVMTIIFGALTSVGGGAIRDISVGETPGVFQSSNFYAVAGLGGATAYTLMATAGAPLVLAAIVCVFVVFSLRYWSVYFDWRTTNDPKLSRHLRTGARKVKSTAVSTGRGILRAGSFLFCVFLHGGTAEKSMKSRHPKVPWHQRAGWPPPTKGCECEGTGPEAEGGTGPRTSRGTDPEAEEGTGPRDSGGTGPRDSGGTGPEDSRGTGPGISERTDSEASRGTGPQAREGTGPEAEEGTGPEDSGGTGPEDSGGTGPRTSRGTGPRDSGGTGPGVSERTDSEASRGTDPQAREGTGPKIPSSTPHATSGA